jgi:hypothetical protein
MKRVLRSCLDPLPRFLSTRALVAVVAFVVLGTALSVYEYVESGRPPRMAWPKVEAACPLRSPAAEPRARPLELRATTSCTLEPAEASAQGLRAAQAEAPQPAAAFEPDTTGS